MKIIKLLTGFIITLTLILMLETNTGCTNPDEYKPQEDSLIEPPDPPELVFPPMDTEYVLLPEPGYVEITFDWTPVNGADHYELEYASNPDFINAASETSSTDKLTIIFSSPIDLYWRVRAESPAWKWYTDWSEARFFRIRPPL